MGEIIAGDTNQATAIIYYITPPPENKKMEIAKQTVRSKTGPGGNIADTIEFEYDLQDCLQLYSHRNSK